MRSVRGLAVVFGLVAMRCNAASVKTDAASDSASDIVITDATDDAAIDVTTVDAAAPPDVTAPDVENPDVPVTVGAPRLVRPLSGSIVSTAPTLVWAPAAGSSGTRIEVCADRACSVIEDSVDVAGGASQTAMSVSAGVHYWRAWALVGSVRGAMPSAAWEFVARGSMSEHATPGALDTDLNGDGLGDVVIEGVAMAGMGGLVEYDGSASGVATSPSVHVAFATMCPPGAGCAARPVGDVNGDGFGDVGVGGMSNGFVFGGSAHGLMATPIAMIAFSGSCDPMSGCRVVGAGDVNGDGFGDVIALTMSGGQMFMGTASGVVAGPMLREFPQCAMLCNAAPVGDIDGDGFADVVVTGVTNTGTGLIPRAVVYAGNATSFGSAHVDLPPATNFRATPSGIAISAGDLNGDGSPDVVLSATGPGPSAPPFDMIEVFYGTPMGLATTATTITTSLPVPPSGDPVAVGDVNGDGLDDAVVLGGGAGGVPTGAVFVGAASGIASVPSTTLGGVPTCTPSGCDLATYADLNGDGRGDIVLVGVQGGGTLIADPRVYYGNAAASFASASVTLGGGPLCEMACWLARLEPALARALRRRA